MPYTNFKYEISKWLEKLRKSTKNSVRLADIPTKFQTKHFLNTHQKVPPHSCTMGRGIL